MVQVIEHLPTIVQGPEFKPKYCQKIITDKTKNNNLIKKFLGDIDRKVKLVYIGELHSSSSG
jgi:hypothetical protein